MKITGLDRLVFGVEDLPKCTQFYRDFGLAEVSSTKSKSVFRTVEKAEIELRLVDDPELPPPVTPGSQLRQILWGVADAKTLSEIKAELARDREVKTDADGAIWTIDPMGYGTGFRITQITPVDLDPQQINDTRRALRVNARVELKARPPVFTLGHVVVYCPNLEETNDFYRNRLGFRLSDSFESGEGYFLRAAGTHEHHNIFLFHLGGDRGVNHVSFGLRGIDEVALAGEYLEKQGWQSLTGPGRHYIGSNYFWYFHSPAGGAVEYYADMDYLTDDWVPGKWEFRPDVVAAWDRGPGFIPQD
jgi:catechol 2,3-dioxygenase-like lactoylglutathione lyase family enzyme